MDDILLKIKQLQNEKKLTTKDFSKLLGVSSQAIYDLYNGKTQISLKLLENIKKTFGKNWNYFFEDNNGSITQTGKTNLNGINNGNIKIQEIKHDNELLLKEIEKLNQRIIDLETRIKDKDELIEVLKDKK